MFRQPNGRASWNRENGRCFCLKEIKTKPENQNITYLLLQLFSRIPDAF